MMKTVSILLSLLLAGAPSFAANLRPGQPSSGQGVTSPPTTANVSIVAAGVDTAPTSMLAAPPLDAARTLATPDAAAAAVPAAAAAESLTQPLDPAGLALPTPGPIQISAVSPQPDAVPPAAPANGEDGPTPTAQQLDDSLHPLRGHPNQLGSHFRQLHAAFHLIDEVGDSKASHGDHWAGGVLAGIEHDLVRMSQLVQLQDPQVYEHVLAESGASLALIAKHMNAGRVDIDRTLRLSPDDEAVPVSDKPLKLGFYAVASDPFQLGHLLIALRAAARYQLDKVVFVLAGDDPRKPEMTPVAQRHPMGQAVLAAFAPLFAYSPIAVGTNFDGETNLFRILGLNAAQAIEAYYLVGDDHYGLVDRKGNPDTLPKLEKNLADLSFGHDPALHQVRAAFIQREGKKDPIPTTLPVDFLPSVGFEVSSSMIRKQAMYFLMPAVAYEIALRLGLYGLKPK